MLHVGHAMGNIRSNKVHLADLVQAWDQGQSLQTRVAGTFAAAALVVVLSFWQFCALLAVLKPAAPRVEGLSPVTVSVLNPEARLHCGALPLR